MRVECKPSDRPGSQGIFKYISEAGDTAAGVWDEAIKELREEFPDDRVIFLGPLESDDVLVLEVVEA